MEIIELVVFALIVLAALVLLFFVIRISTRSSKKVELLEILVEQQDYQILMLKQILKQSGIEIAIDEDEIVQPQSKAGSQEVKSTTINEVEKPVKKEYEDLGVSEIFPER